MGPVNGQPETPRSRWVFLPATPAGIWPAWENVDSLRPARSGVTSTTGAGGWSSPVAGPYVAFESASTLLAREALDVSPVGPALVIVSLIVMPVLAWGKWQVARRINSAALKTDSQEALLCVYLSAIFLVGFAANALFGWWRADPVAGLGVAALAVKEGWEAVANQDLCCDEQPIRSTLPVAASHGTDSAVAPAPG